LFSGIKFRSCVIICLASAFLAFGLYHVHAQSGITEGGVLGLTLLLQHWLHLSPAISGFVLNVCCYLLGWHLLGRGFIFYSLLSTGSFSVAYRIFEQFDPLWPQLSEMPLAAALLGAAFVGIGCGVCVRAGAATGGDDALAMSLSHLTHIGIQWIYLFSDLAVLLLSLSYLPPQRIGYSLLTVILSGQIIGGIQKIRLRAFIG
jgi:uncharacterized membrane-anchored protein YitT (DUF2179 family)